MSRAYSLFACFLIPVALAVVAQTPKAEAADSPTLKIGVPETMFAGVHRLIVQSASKPFQKMFEKQSGLKGEIHVARDYAELADQLRSGKLDIAIFHGFEYAWVKHHEELVPLVTTVPGSKLQACLVVNVDSKAKDASDLKGDCVAIPAVTKAHCHLFLEHLKTKLPANCCGQAKVKGKTIEDALDAVSDDICPAAIVDGASLSAYMKLKPGAGAGLKVLVESASFPSAIVVYRKGALTAEQAKKVSDGLIKSVTTNEGQFLLSLWQLKGFSEVTPEYTAVLEKCHKAYPAPK